MSSNAHNFTFQLTVFTVCPEVNNKEGNKDRFHSPATLQINLTGGFYARSIDKADSNCIGIHLQIGPVEAQVIFAVTILSFV